MVQPRTPLRSRRSRRALVGLAALALGAFGALVAIPDSGAVAPPAVGRPDGVVPGSAADGKANPFRADAVIVGFDRAASAADRAAALGSVAAQSHRRLSPLEPDAELVRLPAGHGVDRAIAALSNRPGVRYAEPDYVRTAQATSNDTYFTNGSLWGMYGDASSPANQFGSQAAEAWAAGDTGSKSIVIGVIDEGIQWSHPDLNANIWTNPGEIDGNGIDDDGNGYIDDVHGYDFVNNDGSVYDSTADDHATHVAGTIGGVGGNGTGVAGVNWNVTMISAKFLGANGGYTSDAVRALDYLTALKSKYSLDLVATSNSWGGGGADQSLLDAINRSGDANILFIAAAGNGGTNNDTTPNYPSNYQCTTASRSWDCVIAVAAIDSSGNLASFSQYGKTTVDIGAPGVGVMSTLPLDTYGSYSGTSMATPHVSGAAALCASVNPAMRGSALRAAIAETSRSTASLAGKTVNGGRLDVPALLARCRGAVAAMSGTPSAMTVTGTSSSTMRVNWTDGVTNETGYEVRRAPSSSGVCGTYVRIALLGADANVFYDAGLTASTTYCYSVAGLDGTNATASTSASGTTSTPPLNFTCAATTYSWIDPTGGTTIGLTDESMANVTLPFTYNWFGTSTTTAVVSSNGFLRFDGNTTNSYANVGIPGTSDPNAMAAAFWEDLDPGAGGSVSYKTVGTSPNRQFVVSWVNVPVFGVTGSALTFQAIVEESTKDVVFQYLDAVAGSATYDRGASATVGVEDQTGSTGVQISYNTASIADASAYRCDSPYGPTGPTVSTTSLLGASQGVGYSQTLAATGGTAPYAWSIDSGALPNLLSLTGSTGVISGTPDTLGTSTFTVRVTDANGAWSTRSFSITVATPVSVTTASLPGGAVTVPYSQTLAAAGGTNTYTWAIASGALPAGVTLGTNGVISGVPSSAGTATFTVRATDGAARTATSGSLSIVVATAPTISTASLPGASTNVAYSTTLAASGGTPSQPGVYTWTVASASGTFPSWASLGSTTGVISGSPTATGSSTFTIRVTDSLGATSAKQFTLAVTAPVVVSTVSLADGTVGTAYSRSLAATGGASPYTWTSTGSLPAGLSMSSAGAITGTPTGSFTAPTTSSFTVTVKDSASRTATANLSITVYPALAITTASVPAALLNAPYSQTLAATGGRGTYTWAVSAGTLPTGLTFSSAGVLSGTPTKAGTTSITFKVTDADARTTTKALSIVVSALPGAFAKSSPANNATAVAGTATLSWAASTGATSYEVCLVAAPTAAPATNAACPTAWISTGTTRTYTSTKTAKTVYYWQVRAVNAVGNVQANTGAWWKFTTA